MLEKQYCVAQIWHICLRVRFAIFVEHSELIEDCFPQHFGVDHVSDYIVLLIIYN